MLATFDVSKLVRSSSTSDAQPLNMELMSVTSLVSKPERSSDVSATQRENMELMFVTFEVSRPERSIDSALFSEASRLQELAGAITFRPPSSAKMTLVIFSL